MMHKLLLEELLPFRQYYSQNIRAIDGYNRYLILKNKDPFIKSKFNNVLTENGQDIDIVMSMYNSIEYSKIYLKTSGTLLLQRYVN